jgi:predicted negative regulator of RcsB-dependent stress response
VGLFSFALLVVGLLALGAVLGWTVRENAKADRQEVIGRAYDHAIESYREARHEIERAKRRRR